MSWRWRARGRGSDLLLVRANGIGAVTLATRGASGQAVEVPYLRPEERSGSDVALAFTLDTGTSVEGLECRTHVVETRAAGNGRVDVTLSPRDTLPNRDFVLRYRLAGEDTKAALVTQRAGDEVGRD